MGEVFASRVLVPPHVLVRDLEGELVLLNVESEHYFGLDAVGTRMWVALTGSPTVEEAYAHLSEEYEVEPDRLRVDLADLVSRLVSEGLLELQAV
jgi:hypothetical protein